MSATKLIVALLFPVLIGTAVPASAQTTVENEAAVTSALTLRVQNFFDYLKDPNVNPEAAFSDLLANSPLLERPEQLGAFVASYKKLEESAYGRFLAAKQVHVKHVGEDLVFLTFLYETERFPIVWRIALYRPPIESAERADWFVVRLSFDTKIEELPSLD